MGELREVIGFAVSNYCAHTGPVRETADDDLGCDDCRKIRDDVLSALRAHFAKPGAVTDETRAVAATLARSDVKRLLASPEYTDKSHQNHTTVVAEVQRLFDLIYPEET